MIDYIKGIIVELSPAELILENNGIGYSILISLQTFQALQDKKKRQFTYSITFVRMRSCSTDSQRRMNASCSSC